MTRANVHSDENISSLLCGFMQPSSLPKRDKEPNAERVRAHGARYQGEGPQEPDRVNQPVDQPEKNDYAKTSKIPHVPLPSFRAARASR